MTIYIEDEHENIPNFEVGATVYLDGGVPLVVYCTSEGRHPEYGCTKVVTVYSKKEPDRLITVENFRFTKDKLY